MKQNTSVNTKSSPSRPVDVLYEVATSSLSLAIVSSILFKVQIFYMTQQQSDQCQR